MVETDRSRAQAGSAAKARPANTEESSVSGTSGTSGTRGLTALWVVALSLFAVAVGLGFIVIELRSFRPALADLAALSDGEARRTELLELDLELKRSQLILEHQPELRLEAPTPFANAGNAAVVSAQLVGKRGSARDVDLRLDVICCAHAESLRIKPTEAVIETRSATTDWLREGDLLQAEVRLESSSHPARMMVRQGAPNAVWLTVASSLRGVVGTQDHVGPTRFYRWRTDGWSWIEATPSEAAALADVLSARVASPAKLGD